MHRVPGPNRLSGPAQGDHGFPGVGQNGEPFKIREQIKLEALDSDEDEEMASNSIFESFSSYQSCFSR
ncbi:hypothetical protein F2P79_017841, partial [Pimephales promelas]